LDSKSSHILLETAELSKDYLMGSEVVNALREVSVQVKRGEFVAVMGPSGSGKSTFMNLIGCLDRPSSGRYLFEGRDMSQLNIDELARTRNHRVGFVFQNFSLLSRTSALENVELPLMYGKVLRRDRKATAVLEAVGLKDRIRHQSSQLSGGQQQRVAIARAIVNDPALILADEPTGALDTLTGIEIMALFQALNRDGRTIVVVTHESDIAQFADRILRFRDGRLIKDERVEHPEDARKMLLRMSVDGGKRP
jgi:putative ABC transport system ATP-binding protein